MTGFAGSTDFPATAGAFDTSHNGRNDVFVAKLTQDGNALVYATYLGGSEDDFGWDIAVDRAGNAHVTGYTSSVNFPTTPGAFDTSHNGNHEGFVAKLNPTGSVLAYATFLGGSSIDYGRGIAVGRLGNAYVTGYTRSHDFPTTPGAFDTSFNGGDDAFVVMFNTTGDTLIYATFLGVGNGDAGRNIAIDGRGYAYVVGDTWSTDFPTTPGAFDTSHNGSNDAFLVKINVVYVPNVAAPIEQPSAGAFVSGTLTLQGFAIDLTSSADTGIDMIYIDLDGTYGTGVIIGGATYGLNRPDVAAEYGERFGPSGWELDWDTSGVTSGPHWLYLYAHRTTDNAWSLLPPHLVVVAGGHTVWLPLIARR